MIASLPMYDWPEVGPSTDRLWALIRDRMRAMGLDAPDGLDRTIRCDQAWTRPDLVLGQTCGLPFATTLRGKVVLIGTVDYGLLGAKPGQYYSQIVTRADRPGSFAELSTGILAINGFDSQSGWGSIANDAAAAGLRFTRVLVTGAHRESASAVAEGRADLAAVDAVTWRLICAYLPEIAAGLRILARTTPTPGLPLIAAPGTDAARTAMAVASAIGGLEPLDRAALGINGFTRIPEAEYHAVPVPERPAAAAL